MVGGGGDVLLDGEFGEKSWDVERAHSFKVRLVV